VPKETFLTHLNNCRKGPAAQVLGYAYAAGWIFFFVAGLTAGHESRSATFSYPVPMGGSEHQTLYFRPWIAWWLHFGPRVLLGLVPLLFLAEWLRWRRHRTA
jgi:hypothetical protein